MRMTLTKWLVAPIVLATGTACAQEDAGYSFVVLADPQFGAFTADADFAQETANLEFVVANLNRLEPAFVVICGDLINRPGDASQRDEYFRIMGGLDPSIPVYAVAGNHDVGNEPTAETLAAYREHFGPDYYSFEAPSLTGIVLDSSIVSAPGAVPDEAAAQEAWLEAELKKAAESEHILVFQHHPWFLESPDEPEQYFNLPLEPRKRYLELLKRNGVSHVFAGHLHRNAYGADDGLEMITTGPVGRPLGSDPSGIRIVHVTPGGIEHEYYPLGMIPNSL